MNSIEAEQIILLDLIHNQIHYKSLIEDLKKQIPLLLEIDPLFEEEIKINYFDLIRSRLLNDIATRLKVTAEDALIVLDTINLKEYLK